MECGSHFQRDGHGLSGDARQELEDWTMALCFSGEDPLSILCCPEDRRCKFCAPISRQVCAECEVPLCKLCAQAVDEGSAAPPAATSLANDMMIYYAPSNLYRDRLTVMEMICCSPCITSLLCFSMEIKYGHMLDSEVHMHRHRVGARGNATSFMLPWEALLK